MPPLALAGESRESVPFESCVKSCMMLCTGGFGDPESKQREKDKQDTADSGSPQPEPEAMC